MLCFIRVAVAMVSVHSNRTLTKTGPQVEWEVHAQENFEGMDWCHPEAPGKAA